MDKKNEQHATHEQQPKEITDEEAQDITGGQGQGSEGPRIQNPTNPDGDNW